MSTYMRSDAFKSSKSGNSGGGPSPRTSEPRSAKLPEDEIPTSPPAPLRGEYLKVSWAYVYWCIGMLVWTVLCVLYFILTRQMTDMIIGIAPGLLLVAKIHLPANLFGGSTWFKRHWGKVLPLAVFSVLL